jgi:response regulator RpfG family c-di-GMP phosphodiesterase
MPPTSRGSHGRRVPLALDADSLILGIRTKKLVAALMRGLGVALALTAEARAGCTIDHLERVSRWALLLTERFAPELVHDPRVEVCYLLHDIGMLGVPETIRPAPHHKGLRRRPVPVVRRAEV